MPCYTGDGLLLLNAPLPRAAPALLAARIAVEYAERVSDRSYTVHPPGPLSGQQGDRTVTLLAPTAALLNPG